MFYIYDLFTDIKKYEGNYKISTLVTSIIYSTYIIYYIGKMDYQSIVKINIVITFLCCFALSNSLILKGEWNSRDDPFLFLSRFGFQKTNPLEGDVSEGYLFGNITSLMVSHY